MRVSWRNLDWVGEADRGRIEKKLAEIGGAGSGLLDRVEFSARQPTQTGAPFEVRITGNVAKNQITAVRRDTSVEAAFHAALEAFERSALSVRSAKNVHAVSALQPARVQSAARPAGTPVAQSAALVSRWRPDLSIPRLNLNLDRQALLERLAPPTRGVWRAAASRLPQLSLRRGLAQQTQRSRDRARAEALERLSWRERLAALAMWNEIEAAERWAREQVFQRRVRSELEQLEEGAERREVTPAGWRGRLADLSLWSELEAAERWAREQVLARLRRGERELADGTLRALPAQASDGRRGWRERFAGLAIWDALERFELRLRSRDWRAKVASTSTAGLLARLPQTLRASGGLVARAGDAALQLLRLPMPVRLGASLGVAAMIGLWSFQGASFTDVGDSGRLAAATFSAVAMTSRGAGGDEAYSAVAVPFSWGHLTAPYSAVAAPENSRLASEGTAYCAVARPPAIALEGVAYGAVSVPDRSLPLSDESLALNSGAY